MLLFDCWCVVIAMLLWSSLSLCCCCHRSCAHIAHCACMWFVHCSLQCNAMTNAWCMENNENVACMRCARCIICAPLCCTIIAVATNCAAAAQFGHCHHYLSLLHWLRSRTVAIVVIIIIVCHHHHHCVVVIWSSSSLHCVACCHHHRWHAHIAHCACRLTFPILHSPRTKWKLDEKFWWRECNARKLS